MNILLFRREQLIKDLIHIDHPEKIAHIQTILKLKKGSELRVGEINGLMGVATIESMSDNLIILKPQLTITAPKALPCCIVLALPRPQQLKRILLHLSSLGVKDIHLIQTARVEKNYWQSPTLHANEIENYLIEGLEQAQDTILPSLEMHKHWPTFLEKYLPQLIKNKQAWLAQPGIFPYCPAAPEGEHVLIVGPEGGFIDEEVQQLCAAGCTAVSIGERILKVETAIPVLISRLFEFH